MNGIVDLTRLCDGIANEIRLATIVNYAVADRCTLHEAAERLQDFIKEANRLADAATETYPLRPVPAKTPSEN
jgi:hypothetical protein